MIEIDAKKEYDLNNVNVAGQNIQLGTYLKEISNKIGGSSLVWDDIIFPLTVGKQGQTDLPAFDTANIGYLFPQNNTSQVIYIIAQMPHGWALGTPISPHMHWKQEKNENCRWKMDYKWFPIGGQVPLTYQTYVMDDDAMTYTSGSLHQLTSGSADIDGSHISGVSSMLLIKLYRDDNTYTGNALAYQMDIHIQKDTFGSSTVYSK